MGVIDKARHIAWAADAVAAFQKHCGTRDEHAIADLICDLGHLAEERGFNFLTEVKRAIGHWYAEHHSADHDYLGPDAVGVLSGVSPALASVAESERLISWSSLATRSLALVAVLVAAEAVGVAAWVLAAGFSSTAWIVGIKL
jgi:hypothetical protein